MRTRARWTTLGLLVAAVACGDQPTEVVPERNGGVAGAGTVALATASTEDGLSITTDKDDYLPGDTVRFTGAGWPANDTLDILLEDEPATHEPHRWLVQVDDAGTFRDSTYVVDVGDLGVMFTLTATSRATGRTLFVTFYDGNVTAATAPTTHAPNAAVCSAASKTTFTLGETACAQTTITVQTPPAGGGDFRIQWVSPSNVIAREVTKSGDDASTHVDQFAPTSAGTWLIRACRSTGNCTGPTGAFLASSSITVNAPVAATKLAFTTDARTAAVGQCTAQIDVQSQSAAGVATNVTAGTPLTLTSSSSGGSFYTDAACTTSGSVSIPAGGNTASFYYKDSHSGSPTLTAAAAGLTQATQVQTITDGNALVTVSATPVSPTVFGQSVTFTAAVSAVAPAVGTPTGNVTFHDGAACTDPQIGASKTLSGGSATSAATSTLTVGDHTITACYGGGGGFVASTGQIAHTVDKAESKTTVGSSPNPSVYSEDVTFTVTVAAVAPGTGVPAGSVTLFDGTCTAGTQLGGAAALSGGEATFTVSSLGAGGHTVTACYGGSGNYEESEGTVAHTVQKAATGTTVSSSANPSVFSQPLTFEVTVAAVSPASAVPVGNVVLRSATCAGSILGASKALNNLGKASFNVTALTVGTHAVVGCYAGNEDFESSHGNVSQVVNQAATSTKVESSDDQSVFSQQVTFTVTVTSDAPAVAVPAGNVMLKNGTCAAGATLGGPNALGASGVVTFEVSTLSVGTHTITGCYQGNASFEGSDGSVSQKVDKAPTTTTISSSVNPSILAQPVTFSVAVSSDAPATATPEGNVTLKEGTCDVVATIDGPRALSGGQVSFEVSSLTAGVHTIVACYAGNTSFEGSDKSLSQQVKYNFEGLFAPVNRPDTLNLSKAGQAIPLKWRLTDFKGLPVLNFTSVNVTVSGLPCTTGASLDQIEEYAGNSGLQNLGDGYYQFNWKTASNYANSCRAIGLNLGEGTPRGPLAWFNFKK